MPSPDNLGRILLDAIHELRRLDELSHAMAFGSPERAWRDRRVDAQRDAIRRLVDRDRAVRIP